MHQDPMNVGQYQSAMIDYASKPVQQVSSVAELKAALVESKTFEKTVWIDEGFDQMNKIFAHLANAFNAQGDDSNRDLSYQAQQICKELHYFNQQLLLLLPRVELVQAESSTTGA